MISKRFRAEELLSIFCDYAKNRYLPEREMIKEAFDQNSGIGTPEYNTLYGAQALIDRILEIRRPNREYAPYTTNVAFTKEENAYISWVNSFNEKDPNIALQNKKPKNLEFFKTLGIEREEEPIIFDDLFDTEEENTRISF